MSRRETMLLATVPVMLALFSTAGIWIVIHLFFDRWRCYKAHHMISGELNLSSRQGVRRAVVQFADAHAVKALFFHLKHRSQQKLTRHLFDGKANSLCGGAKPTIADGPIASPATAWKQVGWRVVIEVWHRAPTSG